ncbi:hypothetical protein CDAR_608861 [Caerostris darwini]|uniref:Uncharacterized protein n=1 Tax=Caerostris darwini TaxID=1538125 RepID=A0AAV4WLF0_9ARAC|nr:hypothetical protein CDAR_608861 [Caerostris darwini]
MVGFGSLLKPRSLVVIVSCGQDEIIGYVKETSGLNFKIALLRSQFRQRIVGYWNAVWKIVLDLEVLVKFIEDGWIWKFWLNLLKMVGFGSLVKFIEDGWIWKFGEFSEENLVYRDNQYS